MKIPEKYLHVAQFYVIATNMEPWKSAGSELSKSMESVKEAYKHRRANLNDGFF